MKKLLFNVLAISISLSLDALGIGISYKLKGVKITHAAKITIGIVSIVVMWLSLKLGSLMTKLFPVQVANILGISILILIGVTFIRNALFGNQESTYDFNKSKEIDWWEAAVLGVALSADSVSAGIAAVSMGLYNMFIPFTVGMMQVIFLYMADLLLEKSNRLKTMNRKICGVLSGCLLIGIAILRIFNG